MATTMNFLVNHENAALPYFGNEPKYKLVDLTDDFLLWTTGDTVVKEHMTSPPEPGELNAAATLIPDTGYVTVPICFYEDYDANPCLHTVIGMGIDGRYVFCFNFIGATATIPRLEAWDTSAHLTANLNVLGLGTATNSFVKAIKTTDATPGAGWVAAGSGTAIAGAANYLNLDTAPLAGNKDLYCNIAIRIPYTATPSAELFCLTIRYTYL